MRVRNPPGPKTTSQGGNDVPVLDKLVRRIQVVLQSKAITRLQVSWNALTWLIITNSNFSQFLPDKGDGAKALFDRVKVTSNHVLLYIKNHSESDVPPSTRTLLESYVA